MYTPSFRPFVSEIDIRWSAGRPAAAFCLVGTAAYENAAATNAALSKAKPVTAKILVFGYRTAFLTRLLREIVAQERFQPLNNPDDSGTITQKTRLGARGERGDAGSAKEKRRSRLGPQRRSVN